LNALLRDDDGSASLEFITAGLILLVPLVYLVIAMANIQGASLAVAGAARQAARVYVTAPDATTAQERARRAVVVALADYGVDAGTSRVTVRCAPRPSACLTRNGSVTVRVDARARLPLMPNVLDLDTAASVAVRAAATQTVSRFWVGEG
jgi:TadE-like protein.